MDWNIFLSIYNEWSEDWQQLLVFYYFVGNYLGNQSFWIYDIHVHNTVGFQYYESLKNPSEVLNRVNSAPPHNLPHVQGHPQALQPLILDPGHSQAHQARNHLILDPGHSQAHQARHHLTSVGCQSYQVQQWCNARNARCGIILGHLFPSPVMHLPIPLTNVLWCMHTVRLNSFKFHQLL